MFGDVVIKLGCPFLKKIKFGISLIYTSYSYLVGEQSEM